MSVFPPSYNEDDDSIYKCADKHRKEMENRQVDSSWDEPVKTTSEHGRYDKKQLAILYNKDKYAKLSKREQRFVELYISGNSATESAVKAGYKRSTADLMAKVLLKEPNIQEEINWRVENNLRKSGFTKEKIIQEWCKLAFTNLTDVIEWNADGESIKIKLKSSDDIDSNQAAAIKKLAITKGNMQIEMHDKGGALKQLGELLGIYPSQKVELTGKDGEPIQIDAVKDKLLSKIGNLAVGLGTDSSGEKDVMSEIDVDETFDENYEGEAGHKGIDITTHKRSGISHAGV